MVGRGNNTLIELSISKSILSDGKKREYVSNNSSTSKENNKSHNQSKQEYQLPKDTEEDKASKQDSVIKNEIKEEEFFSK